MFGNNDPLFEQRAFPPSNPTSVIEISEKEAWWERASLKNDNREGNVVDASSPGSNGPEAGFSVLDQAVRARR